MGLLNRKKDSEQKSPEATAKEMAEAPEPPKEQALVASEALVCQLLLNINSHLEASAKNEDAIANSIVVLIERLDQVIAELKKINEEVAH